MIEYKFRAWDKIHKEMINWEQYKDEMVSNDFEDDDLIIMQWTGMKDNYGKDIYPGDIIHTEGHYPGVGWFDTGEHDYNFKDIVGWVSRELTYSCGGYKLSELDEITIIGNMFENPELMKGEE